ncbi:hypothetical protein BU15DRAFT_79904 [Melanogaster broomeanus]|nr:hypothetical protein BU15DRAFT_79904 [Melanogaster broomeanus]
MLSDQNLTPSTAAQGHTSKQKDRTPIAANKTGGTVAATPTAKPACTATRQVLQEKNTELNDKVAQLAEQLKRAQDALADAKKAKQLADTARLEAEAKSGNEMGAIDKSTAALIPKPPDSVLNKKGESERLQRAMKLQDNKAEYLCIATIHWLSSCVGLDYNLKLAQQPVAALGKLFRLVHKHHPVLERFQNDWATAQLVKQFLQNKCKQENKKRKEAGTTDGHQQNKCAHFDVNDDDNEDNASEGDQIGRGSGSYGQADVDRSSED